MERVNASAVSPGSSTHIQRVLSTELK
jgi:hypothetical protein